MVRFLVLFTVLFFSFGFSLLIPLDSNFYTGLTFHLFKPSLYFFQIFNLIYIFLMVLSLVEVIYHYEFSSLNTKFKLKLFLNFISFLLIRVFFNFHNLLFTFLSSLSLFISLLYLYEEISFIHERSTRYLDINVIYTLLLSAFTFCLYVLNCS